MEEEVGGSARVEQTTREPVPKVKRTYGRKRDDTDASVDATSGVPSRQTRFEPSVDAEEPESYFSSRVLSKDASDTFGWKERLALIDKEFDDEDGLKPNQSARPPMSTRVKRDTSSSLSSSTEDDSSGLRDDTLLSASLMPTSSQSDPPSPNPTRSDTIRTKSLLDGSCLPDSTDDAREILSHGSLRGNHSSQALDADLSKPSVPLTDNHGHLSGRRDATSTTRGRDGSSDEALESSRREVTRKSKAGRTGGQPGRIKKLSKKEERESKKAHARIMADQKVSITKRAEQYTVEHLLKSVQQKQHLTDRSCLVSSDPIQDFTSSPMGNTTDVPMGVEPKAEASGLQSASEDDMPDMRELVKTDTLKQKEDAEVQRRKRLAMLKRQALLSNVQEGDFDSDGDDDLEIISEVKINASERLKGSTALEKRLAGVAGFRAGTSKHISSEILEGSQGDRELKLAAKSTFGDRDVRRRRMHLDHRDLQNAVLSKATRQSMKLTKEKEEEWERRGGKLAGKQRAELASEPLSLGHLAENLALKRGRGGEDSLRGTEEHNAPDSEDSDDEEWRPEERGSMSPSREKQEFDEGELESTAGEMVPVTQLTDTQETDDDDEIPGRPVRHARRSANYLIESDSEGEGTRKRRRSNRILVPDTSFVHEAGSDLFSEANPDEENKENDTPLGIDSGDDKENAIPIERSPVGRPYFRNRQHGGIFDLTDGIRHASLSPIGDTDSVGSPSVRRPLQTKRLGDLDDPFVLRSPSATTSPKTPKSKGGRSAVSSPVSLQPAFGGKAGGFTQLFNDEEGVHLDASSTGLLQPAFRLQSTGNTPKATRRKDGPISPQEKKRSRGLIRNEELSLTLDTKLQPALDVTTQTRRRADAVFEKEQDFVMDEASTSATSSRSRQELYISENGLLTQTKPEDTTPLVYRSWTPSQRPVSSGSELACLPPSTTRRLPLSTLSLGGDTISPSQQRLTRLKKGKGRANPTSDDILGSSPEDRSSNAFVKMLQAAKKQNKAEKRNLGKSDFVEGEAVESDEDEMFGFGQPVKGDDDEESDEDRPDAVVENLLDDAAMDDQELAEDKVLEKVKEHLEEDDAALEKYHQAAIEGKYRGKRRGGGIAMDDSDSDEDGDEEARMLRRRMHKKRKIDGDKLEDLKKDERTKVFYDAYQRDVENEGDNDFAHLAGDDWNNGDESNNEEEPETITTTEIQQRLREAARQNKAGQAAEYFDHQDVTWTDTLATSDDEFQVKEIEDRPKKTTARRPVFGRVDIPDFDDALPRKESKVDEVQAAQLAAWRKEQSGRNFDTGGMRGAITVTGHSSKNPRRGTGSRLKSASIRQQESIGQQQSSRRKVGKSTSILASVSDKHSRFAT